MNHLSLLSNMWVMLAMFWAVESENLVDLKVYKDLVFTSYQECQNTLLVNQNSIRDSLSGLEISNRFSVKCVDVKKHPQIIYGLGLKSS